jgi:competence protein ComEC
VLEEIPVGALWRSEGTDEGDLYARLEASAASFGVPVRRLAAGAAWERGRARLTVLHSGGLLRKVDGVNNQSVVAVFERDGRRVLLTGDAGAPTEGELLREGSVVSADVLKVGHHGSRTATTADFVEAVRPRLALVSCGRRNRFGHPAPETLETLEELAVPVLRTDERSDIRADLLPAGTRLDWRGALRP